MLLAEGGDGDDGGDGGDGSDGGDGGDGQQMARVIGFQKMYGLFGQNHQIPQRK